MIDPTVRKNICIGMLVEIQEAGSSDPDKLTRGYVQKILSQNNHPKGIKVQLTNGKIGRIKNIPTKDKIKMENFKFYNQFFFLPRIYSIWNPQNNQFLVVEHVNKVTKSLEKTAFLFDDYQKAIEFIQGTVYESYPIRTLNRKRTIAENLKKAGAEFVRINKERKVSLEKLELWENYFKNMR